MITNNALQNETVKWRFHPRVFAALGAELVTNDLVALVELVKNAYDAIATRCEVLFTISEALGPLIVIRDDGVGMDRETLLNDWFTVGTPRKSLERYAATGKRRRRVTGEKGLGRLSAARLGRRLRLTTKAAGGRCFRVDMDWSALATAADLEECQASLLVVDTPSTLGRHGTILEISDLRNPWGSNPDDINALRMELARFASPFVQDQGFSVYMAQGNEVSRVDRVKPEPLLTQPDYIIQGNVDRKGVATVSYSCQQDGTLRRVEGRSYLAEESPTLVVEDDNRKFAYDASWPDSQCGPFRLELRVWDLDKDSLFNHADRLGLDRKITVLRRLISDSPFSCVSLYRDGVLVLPKALARKQEEKDAGRDWLGLNARRVSRVGTRINANQLIGFVEITADSNPGLNDASDRERLVDNNASRQFRSFLVAITAILERERDKDRTKPGYAELPMKELLEALRSPVLPQKLDELEKRGGGWKEIREAVEEYSRELTETASQIEKRFYYYSRLATIGSLAALLQHEVGNKVAAIELLVARIKSTMKTQPQEQSLAQSLELAERAVRALKRLADMFAPLASRTFGTRRRDSIVEEVMHTACALREADIKKVGVKVDIDSLGNTRVAVDPGELVGVLDNLLTNSLYWLQKTRATERRILVEVRPKEMGVRTDIRFHDSGPGLDEGDEERIFWPGVTRKEGGLGMGLTVASEIVASHGGKMFLVKPGDLGGASFGFDLPLSGGKK